MTDTINWDQGQRITLQETQTARCESLQAGQLYGLIFYNSSTEGMTVPVTVTWSNVEPPVVVEIPETTGDQAPAWVVLVSGNDTQTVSAAITNASGAQVDTWICSVSMPVDSASLDSTGLIDQSLPIDGQPHSFAKYTRYFQVPPSEWVELSIANPVAEFTSIQFLVDFATFYVLNPTSSSPERVTPLGSVQEETDYRYVQASSPAQLIAETFQGDGSTWVWMSADSEQNSKDSTIALQSLSFAQRVYRALFR